MRKSKAVLLLVVVLYSLLSAIPAYATAMPSGTPYVTKTHVNINLLEPGDRLIYGEVDIPYGTIPPDTADKTYNIQLIDTDNVTVLGLTTLFIQYASGYNLQVFSLYFTAADNLTANQPYIIRIAQSPAYFSSPLTYDNVMPLSSWTSKTTQEDNQTELAINIITIAPDLQAEHTITLLESSAGGTVLSDPAGETYFRGAIYGIQAMAPELFLLQVLVLDTEQRAWTTAQFDTYRSEYSGTWLGTQTDNVSGTFGITTPTLMSLIFLLPITVGAIILSSIKFKTAEPGFIFSLIVLLLGAVMGWISPALFANIQQLFVIYTGYLLFYSGSS